MDQNEAEKTAKQAQRERANKIADALALLAEPDKLAPRQLPLFEDFAAYNESLRAKPDKNQYRLTKEQEVGARLLALGCSRTEAYLLSHPCCKKDNKNALYVKASKFASSGKIRLRVEALQEAAKKEALMPLTRAYLIISDLAENAAKEEVRRAAVNDVLKLHGAFKDEFSLTGGEGSPLVVKVVRYDSGIDDPAQKAGRRPAGGNEGAL